jgi:enoyl-CoA hydratase/carnithine racemase
MTVLLKEYRNGVAYLSLNRPEALNALSMELATSLEAGVNEASNREDVRAIVIRGNGGKAFSAGADLKERRAMDADQKWAQSRTLWALNQAMRNSPKPVICVIEGWCLGGGFELMLFCDLRISSDTAVYGWPEMTLGAYPGSGTASILPRLIGPSQTMKMLFATHRNSAAELEQMGLLHWVVPSADIETKLEAVLADIRARAPLALAALKDVVNQALDKSFLESAEYDMGKRRPLEGTKDYEEGIQAHFEKRKPVFVGE